MADEKQQTSAIFKRHEQLKRWEDSDTNKCLNHTLGKDKKVKFQDGCVFLAACSSGDTDEVKRLLDRGADINTANIDGLTALHQACIDDNLDMVEFLVEHGADVDVCDNEGWTPLHATASCGFTEIARYLLRQGANVAAVNNDGDLPYDICEDDTMEKLLQESMDEQGVDADAARREEEDLMMADANQWLNTVQKGESIEEFKHPKTGATALHVASAKGYVKVMTVLLQAGFDINAKDVDGWTPLHAAAHWGQEESCKILAENMCDMESKNLAGQTPFDVADTELVKLLEELKLKQASLKDQQKDLQVIQTRLPASRRSRNDPARNSAPDMHDSGTKPVLHKRSSVTRMSVEQKHNVMKSVDGQERGTLDVIPPEEEKAKSSSSSCSEEEETSSTESETEKKNEINKKSSQKNQPRDRDKPPIMTTVEIKEKRTPEMPKIEESEVPTEKENIKFMDDENEEISNELKKEAEVIGDGLKKEKIFNNENKEIQKEEKGQDKVKPEKIDDSLKNKEIVNNNKEDKTEVDLKEKKKKEVDKDIDKVKVNEKVKENESDKETPLIENVAPKKDREGLKRTVSAPPVVTEVPKISINKKLLKDDNKRDNEIPSWRLGLRKTGSTSMVPHDSSVSKPIEEDKNLPRSASSPRIGDEDENKKNEKNDKPVTRRPYLSSSSFSTADNNNSSMSERLQRWRRSQGLSNPYRYSAGSGLNSTSSYQSSYIPFYKRQQLENERREREKADKEEENKENNRISAPTSLPVSSSSSTISTTSGSTTITTPTSSFTHYRKSYEPPKRDEETEMLRKVRAKRARETRRSTQGVTLEEVQQANEVLRKNEPPIDPSATSSSATTADRTKLSSDDRKSQDSTDSVNKDTISSDRDVSSRLSADVSSNLRRTNSALDSDSSSYSSWRRSRDIEGSKKDDDTATRSSSFRRPRADRDLTSSAPSSSFYSTDSTKVPRNRSDRTERNALSVADTGNTSLGGGVNLTRSTSLRTDRLRSTEDDASRVELRREREKDREKEKEKVVEIDKDDKGDKDDKRPESAAIRSRRMRRERRSTGIANYTPEVIKRIRESAQQWADEKNKDDEDEKDKENKDDNKEEIKTDGDEKSSRYNRYGSTSDVPGHLTTTRPSSYSEYSRSSSSLDKDYKKLYEDEKIEKERLKRELEQCKKELREAKLELDRQMKKNEANRVSDTNDKRERRALERKLSELEEEIKKMDQLKEDNRRLREENGALIRVISKLSK